MEDAFAIATDSYLKKDAFGFKLKLIKDTLIPAPLFDLFSLNVQFLKMVVKLDVRFHWENTRPPPCCSAKFPVNVEFVTATLFLTAVLNCDKKIPPPFVAVLLKKVEFSIVTRQRFTIPPRATRRPPPPDNRLHDSMKALRSKANRPLLQR